MKTYFGLGLLLLFALLGFGLWQSGVMRGAGVSIAELEEHDRALLADAQRSTTTVAVDNNEQATTTMVVADESASPAVPSSLMMETSSVPDPKRESRAVTVPAAGLVGEVKTLLVAGGCFWCVEADLEKLKGVSDVVSGYAGGTNENPTYENYDDFGHREVVKVTYDSGVVSYGQVLEWAIKHMDPTDRDGSFNDRGYEYSPAIYYETAAEKTEAEAVIAMLDATGVYEKPIALYVEERVPFWPAEEYHQDYYKKNILKYNFYRYRSGRSGFIEEHWGDRAEVLTAPGPQPAFGQYDLSVWQNFETPSVTVLRERLTDQQYRVTQEDATERAFENEYWDNKAEGIYVDVVSGEPLFSSTDKFDSGTGWPSFTKPIYLDAVTRHDDYKLLVPRIEIRSRFADSHLGHVFNDAPEELGGIRYCMNSAALRFVPKAQMEAEGYGQFLTLFE